MTAIAAVVSDLIFATKITSTAGSVGGRVEVIKMSDQLDAWLAGGGGALVLIDLEADGIDSVAAIGTCRRSGLELRVVAFGSHVRRDLLAAAREAGADEVMPRSAFVTRLPALLGEVGSGEAGQKDPGQ